MTRYRNFSASTGLAALLAAGIIVLGSADLAWAKGNGGSNQSSSMNRSSGSSNHPPGIKAITIRPIVVKSGSGSSKSDHKSEHSNKHADKHDKHDKHEKKHAEKDKKHHKDDDKEKPPVVVEKKPPAKEPPVNEKLP